MKILKTQSVEKYGNDCLISKDVSLVEMNNSYAVIESIKYSGWMGLEMNTHVHEDGYDYNEAEEVYNKLLDN